MADWKNNKVLGIIAGVVGAILIIVAITSVMKKVSVSQINTQGTSPIPEADLANQ